MSIANCEILASQLPWSLFHGDWSAYKDALYSVFKRDFIDSKPTFGGLPVDIIHQQTLEDKERSFWHIISQGQDDSERKPDPDRCANLPRVKSLIEDDGNCSDYRLWVKWHDKTKKDRYYIWCKSIDYIVILEDRNSHYKLITAYNVMPNKVREYEKEYLKYKKTKTPT